MSCFFYCSWDTFELEYIEISRNIAVFCSMIGFQSVWIPSSRKYYPPYLNDPLYVISQDLVQKMTITCPHTCTCMHAHTCTRMLACMCTHVHPAMYMTTTTTAAAAAAAVYISGEILKPVEKLKLLVMLMTY